MSLPKSNDLRETVLSISPSADGESRVVMAIEISRNGSSEIVMRQESCSSDVGWFEQSRIVLQPEQIASLKATLGSTVSQRLDRQSCQPRDIVPFSLVS